MKKSLVFLCAMAGLIAVTSLLTGCAGTYNPATGRNEWIFISTEEELAMGANVHKELEKEFTFSTDAAKLSRVERIGQRLALVSDRKDYSYQFFLIDKDDLNAFTIPGGRIYIFTGLLDKLPSDDAVAGVLAHEIGHCAARHAVKKFQAAMGYNLIGALVLSQVEGGSAARQVIEMSGGTIMNIVFSSYGRQDEHQSDRLAVRYLDRAGFDMNGMVETLELLNAQASGGNVPLILRTHPFPKDRIVAVKKEIENRRLGLDDNEV